MKLSIACLTIHSMLREMLNLMRKRWWTTVELDWTIGAEIRVRTQKDQRHISAKTETLIENIICHDEGNAGICDPHTQLELAWWLRCRDRWVKLNIEWDRLTATRPFQELFNQAVLCWSTFIFSEGEVCLKSIKTKEIKQTEPTSKASLA